MDGDGQLLEARLNWLEHRAALAEAELAAAEEEVKGLELRHSQTLELLLDTERRRQTAESWLRQHRASFSWQITEPLRAAKRAAQARRHG